MHAMRLLRLNPDQGFAKCARIVGEVMGSSIAWRPVDLRRAGAAGAGFSDALPAGRRAGQFRQHRWR
jgi:hypothetical protein